jgi:guanine deaminase
MTDFSQATLALRGTVLHFLADPGLATEMPCWQCWDDGLLVFAGKHVLACGDVADIAPQLPDTCDLRMHSGQLIVPGFVDCHVHSGQMDVTASYGTQLLEWLEKYTFPAEAKFADMSHAQAMSAWFLDTLLANGTTTAAVFPTFHAQSVDAIFEAAEQRGMRLLSGKVMMDRHVPGDMRDALPNSENVCRDLIERWHGRSRLEYLITPRFAASSSAEQLQSAGELAAAYELSVQSHLSENRSEVEWVRKLFPEANSYTEVYDNYGLLRPGSIYAHGIWLDDEERALLAKHRTAIAFCPSSNLFMGSGLFDLRKATEAGVTVGLATDIGGGTCYNMLQTMAAAYQVLQLRGQNLSAWRAFYLATLGGATALGKQAFVGNFMPGKEADAVVLDFAVDRVQTHRQSVANGLEEKLFVLMMLGHSGNIAATYVNGRAASPTQAQLEDYSG